MAAPVTPSQLRSAVPSVNGGFCTRFLNLLKFPQLFASNFAYERNEQGDITPEFCADIQACVALGGTGGTPGTTGGTLDTPVVTATDGTFTDKVVVTWTAPVGATRYEVWRGADSNVADAHKIADVNSVLTFSDTTVDVSTVYWYFVRAFNDTPASSSYSVGDSGYAGTLIPSLGAATDLVASKGFYSREQGAVISLVWTKVADVQSWDIYRNTIDDWTTATRIDQDRTPYVFNDAKPTYYGTAPQLVDNGAKLCYLNTVGASANDPNSYVNYFYWVVGKRSNPAAVGGFSNSNVGAVGWGYGQGAGILPAVNSGVPMFSGGASIVTAPALKAWVVFSGSFAGGAGGNASFGGGGGGAGVIITGLMPVSATGKFRLVSSPESDPAAGAGATSGNDGPTTTLQYSDAGTFLDTIDVCSAAAPTAGLWNGAGGGAAGAGATGTANAVLNPVNIYPGLGGFPAVGQHGGDSGFTFGSFRGPPCPLKILDQFGDAGQGHAGGGADADTPFPASALGGKGLRGRAFVVLY